MIRVFEIKCAVNDYRQLLFDEVKEFGHPLLGFNGASVAKKWKALPVYCPSPNKKRGDFWGVGCGGVPAVTVAAYPHIQTHLEMAGEALPIRLEVGEPGAGTKALDLLILNVTEVVNCLDRKNVKWYGPRKSIFDMDAGYQFLPARLPEHSLFRIPETCEGRYLYCMERSGDPEEDFKAAVEAAGLKGLKFREVWTG